LEEARCVDEGVNTRCLSRASESVDGRRKSINGISVVERLSTEGLEENRCSVKGRAVINVGIRLDNPDEFLARVVEVELNLVGGGTNRLVTSELELLNEVLVRVLGHLAALIGIKEDVINVEGGSNKGLLVGGGDRHSSAGCLGKGLDSPQALTNRAEVNVDFDLVVLEGDEGKSKSRVAAKPEKKRDVKGGFREGLAGCANLGGSARSGTRSRDFSEGRVSDVGQLGGVANHLVVTLLLFRRQSELVPDVHPVTIVAIDALASNLNLNLSDELLTNEV
jgi:hypothetical protein